jgi:hypothetical protein
VQGRARAKGAAHAVLRRRAGHGPWNSAVGRRYGGGRGIGGGCAKGVWIGWDGGVGRIQQEKGGTWKEGGRGVVSDCVGEDVCVGEGDLCVWCVV